ncbi:MAG TPA: ATP-binding protein, partial [Bacteroidales bacterium]|nr:ATP-binding protein [Bacteroidales bacterium]
EMQAGFNKETEIRKLVQEKKDTEQQAQLRRQTYVRNFLLAFLAAILIFAFTAYRGLRRIRRDHRMLTYQQKEILEKNEELNKQKEEILDQAEQIEKTNWELEKKNLQLKQKNEQIKKGQQQLILQEKLATVGQLITGIAHEIQNPLNFVNNFSNLTVDLTTELLQIVDENKENIQPESIEQLQEVTEMIESNVKKINEHGRRADRIIKGMLQQSREAGEFELTDMNILVTEYANLAYHGEKTRDKSLNINIIQNLDKSIGNVNVVPHDLGRVILNLITNSCYAIREKKTISKKPYTPEIHISTSIQDEHIRVSVWDNGIGISPAVKSKIFNPFYTTKPAGEGTGLGLSTSYEIITKVHKGKMEVESKKGEFTEFSFTIPKKIV